MGVNRAPTVAGFTSDEPRATAMLDRFQDSKGFIGTACAAARQALERNAWAQHWFEQMKSVQTPEDFWRYSVLLQKIVDGRYVLWVDAAISGDPSVSEL